MTLTKEHMDTISALCDCFPDPKGKAFKTIANHFIYGDCYVFAKTIQLIIPQAKLRIDLEEEHVVVELDGMVFDAIEKKEPDYGRYFVEEDDDEYCLNEYGYDVDYPRDSICKIETWVSDFAFNHLSSGPAIAVRARLQQYLNMCNRLRLDDAEW